MASIRQLAGCVGIGGTFSVLGDFFGFFRRRVPPDPTGAATQVSLLRQAQRLQGPHYNLNVIAIGVDNFTDAEDIQVDYSIFKLRNIYHQRGVGVGRVEHYGVDTTDAQGLDTPTTRDHLEDITDTWSVPNNGIDLFIPFAMSVPSNGGMVLGRSAVDGPCEDKDDKGMNGSVSGLWGSEQTARTVAHELGHYLGLEHNHGDDCPTSTSALNNLMAQSRCASSTRNSVNLTTGQGNTVKGHCLVKPGC